MNAEELKIIITAEIDQLRSELQAARRQVEDFEDDSKSAFKEFNDQAQKAGAGAKKAFAIIGTAILAAGAALVALAASTKEYREGQAKLEAAFLTAGASAEVATQVYNDLYRVLGDDQQAVEAANHLAQLTTNSKELEQWTKITTGVYATFGDSLPIESLTEAANETAKTGELTGALADALSWAGINVDDFQAQLLACNSEAEREALIRETLLGIYGEAADMYEQTAEDVIAQNEAQLKLNEAMAKLGEAMVPVNTMLSNFAATFIEKLAPILEEFITNHGPAMEAALNKVAEAIAVAIDWIINNWDLIKTLGTVILVIAAAVAVFSTAMGIANAVMYASPITWIIAGIVALIAAITLCVVYWDEIKAAGAKAWEAIKNAWNAAANWFNTKIVQPISNFFKNMWNGLTNGAKNAWNGITSVFSKVTDWFKNTFTKAWTAVKNVFSTGGKIFTGIKDGIANVFKTIVNGIIGGINKVISVPFNAINNMLSKLRNLEILGVSPFGWISTFNVPQIPLLAKGGIVDSATLAVLGEQGKEAVVPLENNTEWIDKIAEKLAARQGNNPIILKVDKRVLGQASAEGINDITRLTGSIPLKFA